MFEKTGDIIYLQLANMWREREKFKVGDKVKYVNNPYNYKGVFNVGDILEVINIINVSGEEVPVYACVKDNPEVYEGFDACELELIK